MNTAAIASHLSVAASACAAGTLAEVAKGYHKIPGTDKVSFF